VRADQPGVAPLEKVEAGAATSAIAYRSPEILAVFRLDGHVWLAYQADCR